MFAREADARVQPRPGVGAARTSTTPSSSGPCVETGADAAWVGWGFVAEDPEFAELCDRIGVVFVGPSAGGDAPRSATRSAPSCSPSGPACRSRRGAAAPVDDLDAAKEHAGRIGYPLMVKAAAGGGGRGIRVVTSDAELDDVFARTRAEAPRAFGSGVVFMERLVTGARHVEVQIIADGQGTAWALGVRDCSVQRRNQKVIEESASPVLSRRAGAPAQGVRGAAGHRGRVPRRRHRRVPLPARRAAVRVPRGQHPAAGRAPGHRADHRDRPRRAAAARRRRRPARGRRRRPRAGTPIEARLNAEDPERDFAPAPGRIALLRLPLGPGIRVDTGVAEGDVIPADFDSMIAKIIAYGRDPRRGAGPAAARAGRHDGRHRGRHDEQVVPARPARAARGRRRQRRHRLARPGPDHRRPRRPPRRRRRPRRRGDRRLRRRRAHRAAAVLRHRARRPPAGPARGRPGVRPASCGGRPTRSRSRRSARAATGSASTG